MQDFYSNFCLLLRDVLTADYAVILNRRHLQSENQSTLRDYEW